MAKLTLEMEIDIRHQWHGAEQLANALESLNTLREKLLSQGARDDESDLILDPAEDYELLGNWRIDA